MDSYGKEGDRRADIALVGMGEGESYPGNQDYRNQASYVASLVDQGNYGSSAGDPYSPHNSYASFRTGGSSIGSGED